MFQFLFNYPFSAFAKGSLVLLGTWPRWILVTGIIAAGVAVAIPMWRARTRKQLVLNRARGLTLWALQAATLAVLLLLLWEPAISVTVLREQQNIVAVVVDNSRSMAIADTGAQREQQAVDLLRSKLLPQLRSQFQVRLYSLGSRLRRIGDPSQLHADDQATQIGAGLKELADDAATIPIGAVVLLSDGSDNSGGVDLGTLNALRGRRLPVNTVGFGRDELTHDVELDAFSVPAKTLAKSRVEAEVTIRQNGFAGQHTSLVVRADGRVVATRDIALGGNATQTERIEFNAGETGVRRLEASLNTLSGEENTLNNNRTVVMSVDGSKHRILYVEGEPRWEYKFIRRAAEDDSALQIVSMLRTTQNKIYRQGISNPSELADGFPNKAEDLFQYDGLVLGSVEAGFFTPAQQEAIKEFVDRRGGGLLFLGGRAALADGDYKAPPFSELLPVALPNQKNTFQRKLVAAELTEQGKMSLICRIEDNPEDSVNHWNVLPYLASIQDAGSPKPGAVVLAQAEVSGKRVPLLVTENYGRGRTAVFATGGSWRWKMQQPVADTSHYTFWRQLLRWTAGSSPSPVVGSTTSTELEDNGKIGIRAEVRDKSYNLINDASVQANIVNPAGQSEQVVLRPQTSAQGIYTADFNAASPGSYVAEIVAIRGGKQVGRDVLTFGREDGVAENFHREQNRDLLEDLARQTGGHYYTVHSANRIPGEISFSEAGITAHETKDLWNMPAVFLALLLLRSTEWVLRRKWGTV